MFMGGPQYFDYRSKLNYTEKTLEQLEAASNQEQANVTRTVNQQFEMVFVGFTG